MRLTDAAFIRQNVLIGSTITASTEEAGYEPENVLQRSADKIYRTIEPDAEIEFALSAPSDVSALLIRLPAERDPEIDHASPLLPTQNITVTIWADRMAPPIFEQTFQAGHDPRYGYIPLIFESAGAVLTLPAEHVRIRFANTAQLDVDAIWCGPLWQPAFNFNRGGQFGFDEQAETDRSGFAGRRFSETRSRILRWSLTWDAWGQSELSQWEDFADDKGLVRPFVVFRTLTAPLARRVMLATFAQGALVTDRTGYHFLIRADFTEDF